MEAVGAAIGGWLATAAADPSLGVSADQARELSEGLPVLIGGLASANLLVLAGWALQGMTTVTQDLGQPVVDLAGAPLLSAIAALLLVGLALAAFFYQQVASAVRGESARFVQPLGGVPRFVLRQAAWTGMLALALFIGGMPLLVLVGLVSMISPTLGLGLLLVVWTLLLIAAWWLYFHTSAMFLDDVGPVKAMIGSIAIVARHRGASLLFVAVTSLIATGWTLVWSGVESIPAGSVLRIAGHTYVSCGLVAATMIFYRDRSAFPAPIAHAGQPIS